MKRKKLLIISHTEHYKENEVFVGWGSTVNEINYLSDYWDEILHVAYFYKSSPPPSSRPYIKDNIRFIGLRPSGGETLKSKFSIIWNIPFVLQEVIKAARGATEVQFRAPTAMGIYILPLFSYFLKRRFVFWVKYAGNWKASSAPWSYRFQRWWLKKNYSRCKVTLNGLDAQQPAHCYSFENPCLTQNDISVGKGIQIRKNFKAPFNLVFVGRLEDAKGVSRIIEALGKVDPELVQQVDFIGDGPKRGEYEKLCSSMKHKVRFHGFLETSEVHKLLTAGHFFLLPSNSEGFPKVIAEAACYGCLPVVSDVGSIADYINDKNGFIWETRGTTPFSKVLETALTESPEELQKKSQNILRMAEMFTFENYLQKLEALILN